LRHSGAFIFSELQDGSNAPLSHLCFLSKSILRQEQEGSGEKLPPRLTGLPTADDRQSGNERLSLTAPAHYAV
jgi:hypothetical protein